jgi:hypothetical protein
VIAVHLRGSFLLGPSQITNLYGIGEIETCLVYEPVGAAGQDDDFKSTQVISGVSELTREAAEHAEPREGARSLVGV